jgi:hypothetical protein
MIRIEANEAPVLLRFVFLPTYYIFSCCLLDSHDVMMMMILYALS